MRHHSLPDGLVSTPAFPAVGTKRVVILGGHGKVALLAAGKLKAANYAVDSIIRNSGQSDAIREAGGNPVMLDIETAGVDELASAFSGAAAIVFSAGAGGGNPQRTHAVDFGAATRAMAAARQAGVMRFVMVSYAGAGEDVHRLDPTDSFYPYARAKHDADAQLRDSTLDYTILGPGLLTTKPATGKLTRTEDAAIGRTASASPHARTSPKRSRTSSRPMPPSARR